MTPKGVASFAILAPLLLIVFALVFFFMLPTALGSGPQLFFVLFFVAFAIAIILPLNNLPLTLAARWRMQASNQMVLCVFYLVTYMRHTSNLELAIDFAGDHLQAPLSVDMKKILWDVETSKYESVRESLDHYLESWKEYNPEFIEAIHLIEGSLLEASEARRLEMIEKALAVTLDETYEKMLHYAHNLKSPLTTLHMLGIILPILGLVILPLVVSFMGEAKWYHIMMLYNVALPVMVYYLGKSMLAKRPTGYGAADITKKNPELRKIRGVVIPLGGKQVLTLSPFALALVVFCVLFLIGFSPLLYHLANPSTDIAYLRDGTIDTIDYTNPDDLEESNEFFLGYRAVIKDGKETGAYQGPFGLGALLLSLAVPLSFGLAIGLYYKTRSGNVMKIRDETTRLEKEFANGLFQLCNRLADGLPAEIAFSKVAEVTRGTATGRFFELVSINIAKLGMSVDAAIFDPERGALREYPSPVIESGMKVLVESSRKGPLIASQAIINVAEYIKQMHRVDERLKDLMADVISSMKSQISFLTPAISGIVVGITSMITKILGSLSITIGKVSQQDTGMAGGGVPAAGLLEIFGSGGIPTYFFQIVVGMYVVQLAYILTILVNGIENGVDELGEEDMLGTNMIASTALYCFLSLVVILIFSLIAGRILSKAF